MSDPSAAVEISAAWIGVVGALGGVVGGGVVTLIDRVLSSRSDDSRLTRALAAEDSRAKLERRISLETEILEARRALFSEYIAKALHAQGEVEGFRIANARGPRAYEDTNRFAARLEEQEAAMHSALYEAATCNERLILSVNEELAAKIKPHADVLLNVIGNEANAPPNAGEIDAAAKGLRVAFAGDLVARERSIEGLSNS